jgi:hypothetical protein
MTNNRQLDIAVKMGVIDCLQSRKAKTPFDREGEDGSNMEDGTSRMKGHKFEQGELIRDLLNLENSKNLRVSRGKGVVRNLTEQFVANASDAIELIQRALVTRKYRYNPESYLVIQFTIVHMESRLPLQKERVILSTFKDLDVDPEDREVQNLSLESIA